MSSSDQKICPQCGAVLEDENVYCGSCGADLTGKESDRSPDMRLLKHRPTEDDQDEILDRTKTSSRKVGRFTPGSQESGSFDKTTFAKASYIPNNKNARIALILGIVGIVVNIILVGVVALMFIKRAEVNSEDHSSIQIAKVTVAIQFVVLFLGIILTLLLVFL